MSDPSTPSPSPSPAPPPPAAPSPVWDAMTWATVVNSAGTLVALGVALFFGLRSLRVAEDGLRATNESLRQNNLSTVYTLAGELTKFDQENPKLAGFFDRELRNDWLTERALGDEFAKLPRAEQTRERRDEYARLWAEYKALERGERVKVYLACQRIADFTQLAFVQRGVLPDDDWNTWWSNITAQYDESPLYRVHLARRAGWYTFLEAIRPENRASYYRGKQKR